MRTRDVWGRFFNRDTKPSSDPACKEEETRIAGCPAEAPPQAAKGLVWEWKPGDVVEGLYRVEDCNDTGGMGRVYFVEHMEWKIRLAVKAPKVEEVRIENREKFLEAFKREAQTWVELGLHPHVVTCFYVRVIGGLPRVFAEYMDGGTLSDVVHEGRIAGLEGVLDLAVQCCRAMDYAHQKGLIHRDLKPGNCLLKRDGTLKIADFGLVQSLLDVRRKRPDCSLPGSAIIVEGIAGTPMYMAPEQFDGEVSFASDIYSFGVMFYEMLTRKRPFPVGDGARPLALSEWEGIHKTEKPRDPGPYPGALKELLFACLEKDKRNRPSSFREIEERLLEIYRRTAAADYPRPRPNTLPLLSWDLNNRALSLLDLNDVSRARELLQRAVAQDAASPEALYNLTLLNWRMGALDDMEAVRRLEDMARRRPHDALTACLLARIHMERGDSPSALTVLEPHKEHDAETAGLFREAKALEGMKCLWTLEGHEQWNFVSQSGDGRYILSSGCAPALKIWDVNGGDCPRILTIFKGRASTTSAVMTPDHRYVLVATNDHCLKLYDVKTGAVRLSLSGHAKWVSAVCLADDGRRVLSASHDGTLKVWDLLEGRCLKTFRGYDGAVLCAALSPDGRMALSGGEDGRLKRWDLESGRCETFSGHRGAVTAVALVPSGTRALSGSSDLALNLWDLGTGQYRTIANAHSDRIEAVSCSPDGRHALSAGRDGTLKLWDLHARRCVRTLTGHRGRVCSVTFTKDGAHAISGGADGTLKLWKLLDGLRAHFRIAFITEAESALASCAQTHRMLQEARKLLDTHPRRALELLRQARNVQGFERSPEGLGLWTRLYGIFPSRGLREAWQEKTWKAHSGKIRAVALSPEDRSALSAAADGLIRIWDLEKGECLRSLPKQEGPVSCAAFSPDGRLILSALDYVYPELRDYAVRIWDSSSAGLMGTLEGHTHVVTSVAISSDGRHALSGSWDGTLRLWDMALRRCLKVLHGHTKSVYSVAVSPDGRFAVSGGKDNMVGLWDLGEGRLIRGLDGHARGVHHVAFGPDGGRILSAGGDRTVRLWDPATGRCLGIWHGHGDAVLCVAFSPDGRYAASGSADETLRLWDAAEGQCLRIFQGHTGCVTAVAFSSDRRRLLSAGDDHTMRLWFLDWELEPCPSPGRHGEGGPR